MKEYYLDNCATTKIDPLAIKEMQIINKKFWGNPSSFHKVGKSANEKLKYYKQRICELLHIEEDELIFTSGGTESDNFAVTSGSLIMREKYGKNVILCSKLEHPAIINACKRMQKDFGFVLDFINADKNGTINLSHLKELLNVKYKDQVAIVCVMRANNELGSVEKRMKQISDTVHENGSLLVCDAVQAVGKIDHGNISSYGADFISFSAHKFHGPKGIGGLYVRHGIDIDPFIYGGGQQNNMRSGTEPLHLISGMCVALDNALKNETDHMFNLSNCVNLLLSKLNKHFDNNTMIFNGERCVPGVINLSFLGINGDMLQIALNEEKIYVSTGSACHSGDLYPSHVLEAIGTSDDYINNAIRISFDDTVKYTDNDITYISDKIIECVDRIDAMSEEIADGSFSIQ